MTPAQREAAARLADELQRFDGAERESLRDETAALLRELAAAPHYTITWDAQGRRLVNGELAPEHRTAKPAQQPQGEPVAWNQTAYAALQQARLALEDLDGPGYLIGGVMNHRIGLILPMLNAAMESLIDHPPQQRKPFSHAQMADLIRAEWGIAEVPSAWNFGRAIERAHGIVEAP